MVLSSFTSLGYQLYVLNRKRTNKLIDELRKVVEAEGLTLSQSEEKRIHGSTALSAITNHWFGLLRGKKPTAEEVSDALYVGAYAGSTDDLMDDLELTYQEIQEGAALDTSNGVISKYTLDKLAVYRSQNPQFEKYLMLTLEAQNDSLAQEREEQLSAERLKELTFCKGGYSTLFYRTILRDPVSEDEENAIYTLGSMLQLSNDVFDIYKDTHNGTQTLPTHTRDYRYISEVYNTLNERLRNQFQKLDYPEKNKRKAYESIQVVLSRARVAIDYYLKVQGEDEKIDVDVERSKLIVDMETVENVMKSIRSTASNKLY